MTDKETQAASTEGNMKKDPDTWVTGEEPMTGAQRSYLKTLSEEAKEPFDDTLNKAQASRRIDELQATTGRHPPQKDQATDQTGDQPAGGTGRREGSSDARDDAGGKGAGEQREPRAEQDARGER